MNKFSLQGNIRVERAIKNITQARLAEMVHVSRQAINAIETAKDNISY